MKTYLSFLTTLLLVVKLVAQDPLAPGIKLLQNENFEAAGKFFEDAFAKDPKNGLAQYYLGEIQYKQDNAKGAETAYNKGLLANSKCGECQVGLIRLKLDQGADAEIAKTVESVVKANSKKNAAVIALLGDAYLYGKKPNPAKALEYLIMARDIDPKIASTWSHMGDAYSQQKGKSGDAMTSYEVAVQKDANNLEAYMAMARIWANAGQLDQAIPKLENALKLVQDYAPAYKLMYELYFRAKKYDKMLPILDKYVSLSGDDVKAKMRLVQFLTFQAKDYDRAISEAEKYNKVAPNDYKIYRWLAWAYAEKEKYEESYQNSKKFFDGAMNAKDSLYLTDWDYLAKAALKTGRLEEADQSYEKVRQFDPTKVQDIYGEFITAYLKKKDWNKVIEYSKKYNAVKELNYTGIANMANAYYYLSQYGPSDTAYQKIIQLYPNHPQAYLMRAKIAALVDSTNTTWAAKPLYEEFIKVWTSEKEKAGTDQAKLALVDNAYYKRGVTDGYNYITYYFVQQNDMDNSKLFNAKALEVDPANKTANEIKTQLEEAAKAGQPVTKKKNQ